MALRSPLMGVLLMLSAHGAWAQSVTVVLLGTGSPEPVFDRFGAGTLIGTGDQRVLVDAGRGVSLRLWQIPVRVGAITQVFLTHLHSDHTVGLADVWLSGWLQTRFGGRSAPLHVYGPPGTAAMVALLRDAYSVDVRQRSQAGIPDSGVAIVGHDVAEGTAYEHGGMRVTAFTVDHGSPHIPALGYRIDVGRRSVVISGDTRPAENVIRFAKDADVLVHEVMVASPSALTAPAISRIVDSHTSPEQAGSVFARANPKLAVYTHVGVISAPEQRQALLEAIIPRTRTGYAGRVVLGEDLMTILVGDSIEVRRPRPNR